MDQDGVPLINVGGEPRQWSIEAIEGAFWFDRPEIPAKPAATKAAEAEDEEMEGAEGGGEPDEPADGGGPSKPAPPRRRRGRGRAKSTLTEEEKKEKNREIQARYRSKQRSQRAELETTFDQAAEELEKARSDHKLATDRNELLDKMVAVRDVSLGILERSQAASGMRVSTVSASEHDAAEISSPGASSGAPSTSDSGSMPRELVRDIYRTFSSDIGRPLMGIADAFAAHSKLRESGDLDELPQYAELTAAVRGMSGPQLVMGWRSFVLQLREIMDRHSMELTRNGGLHRELTDVPAVLQDMRPLFEEQIVTISTALQHNLPAMHALFATAGDVGPDPVRFWRKVAAAMEITPQQISKLTSLWRGYLTRVAAVQQQRVDLLQSLQRAAGAVDSLHAMMERYLTLFDASGRLAASPDSDFLAMIELMRDSGKVWTMLQRAQMACMSYPAFPDTVHLLRAVVDGQREPGGGSGAAEIFFFKASNAGAGGGPHPQGGRDPAVVQQPAAPSRRTIASSPFAAPGPLPPSGRAS